MLLAEDHVLVSEGLTKLLEKDFTLIGCVADGHALVQAVREHTPDVAVIDISLPLLNGLQAARQIKKYEPHTKLIFLTMHGEESYVRDAFQAGGSGYILKQSSTNELVFAIKEVFLGHTYISPSIAQTIVDRAWMVSSKPVEKSESGAIKLTQRQIEILQLVAEGKSNKEVAIILNLAVKTVEFHKTRLMQTLGLKTTSELTKYAISQGIIST
ncbi:MAG: response regulator [Nitrospirales bacterium]|nr:response regulator transcription factor [Nitrospirales bacterium]